MNRDKTRVIIQGFGNVGSNAARLMHQRGYKIIGLARTTGALYNKSGIDIDALWDYQRRVTFEGFPGAEKVDSAELLVTECDILLPAATQITSQNADRVKTRICAKAPTAPPQPQPTTYWRKSRCSLSLTFWRTRAGVTVSYFEWVQTAKATSGKSRS